MGRWGDVGPQRARRAPSYGAPVGGGVDSAVPLWVVPLFLAAFPLFWAAVCWLIARAGWARLAGAYRAETRPTGKTFRMVSGRVGAANYSGVLTVSVEPGGLRLAVMAPFRPGHPPLLFPWDEVRDIRPHKVLWHTSYALDVGPEAVTVQLPERVVEAIRETPPEGP